MENAWDAVQPKEIYQAKKSQPLSQTAQEALLNLYQPILGSEATALYFCLLGDAFDQADYTHSDILNALNLGLPQFFEARKRLEGLGLLKVFVKKERDLGRVFLYELMEPLTPQHFFQEELLSFLLLHYVGNRRFDALKQRFLPEPVDTSGYQEITKSFSEVYAWSAEEYSANQAVLETTAEKFSNSQSPDLRLADNHLDWAFLTDTAKRKFINEKCFTDDLKKRLVLYHTLYGFKEMELVDLLVDSVSELGGPVDVKLLERNASQLAAERVSAGSSQEEDEKQVAAVDTSDFSQQDLVTIAQSKEFAPMEYLTAIKQAKGGFVVKDEEWLVKDLVDKSPLTASVINILINYQLIIRDYSMLNKKAANKTATDWAEKKIRTPEAAIQHIRQFAETAKNKQKAAEKRPKGNYGGNRNLQKVENVPDWTQQQTTSDPQRKMAIDRMKKEYFKNEEGDK